MSAGSFRQNGVGWRINLIKQRFSEWLEYRLSRLDLDGNAEFSPIWWQIIKFFLWSLIAVLLVWITWQLWLLLRPYWKRWQRSSDRNSVSTPQPQAIQLSAADWIERSQSARIEGNYRQAIFCLYQAMLQLLDERDIIPTKKSFTDREYQRSLQSMQISPLQPYELLLSIHQRLCFSNAEATQNMFEECRQAYQQIEK